MTSPDSKIPRIKPTTLQCIAVFLDRRKRPAINFLECGVSGFGDRMRGVAYALFLAKKHRAKKIYYAQLEDGSVEAAQSAFPFQMTDLIAIDGLDFIPFGQRVELNTGTYIHYAEAGNPLKRYGFSEMSRIRPAQQIVADRLATICEAGPFLSVHVRKTDAVEHSPVFEAREPTLLPAIHRKSAEAKTKRVYIAADNADSYTSWAKMLRQDGFDVIENEAIYNPDLLRQTGAEDMLVDFFALARSATIVRTVPSEFSRFAAWVGKKRLRYSDLD